MDENKLETQIGTLLEKVYDYHDKDQIKCDVAPETIKKIDNADNPSFIGIDGSYSFLFNISGMWLAIIRVGALEYKIELQDDNTEYDTKKPNYTYKMTNQWLKEEAVLISTNKDIVDMQDDTMRTICGISSNLTDRHVEIINRLRTRKEQELALEIASKCKNKIIALDGSLTDVSHRLSYGKLTLFPNIMDKCNANNNILVGISKDSTINSFCKIKTDEEYLLTLPYKDAAYIKVPVKTADKNNSFLYGDVYFAKLHRDAPKWFRIDIGTRKDIPNEIFFKLGMYSRSLLCPGYPYPMLEAHRFAVIVRQFHQLYEDEIIKLAPRYGFNMDMVMNGVTHIEGKAAGAFHEYLDLVTRDMG